MGQEPLVWTHVTHNPEILQQFVLNSSGYIKEQNLPELRAPTPVVSGASGKIVSPHSLISCHFHYHNKAIHKQSSILQHSTVIRGI